MLGICFLVLAIFSLAVIAAASPRLADDAGPLAINVGRQKRGDRHLCQVFSSSVNCHADNLHPPNASLSCPPRLALTANLEHGNRPLNPRSELMCA